MTTTLGVSGEEGPQSPLRIVFLGLTITSSWGNGHATTFRGLVRELAARGHDVLFLERDQPWYAENRDLPQPPYGRTRVYHSLRELQQRFGGDVRQADLVIVGSFVPEGIAVGRWVTSQAAGVTAFYDIDTPVTLARLQRGDADYLSAELVPRYGMYLSFSGGPLLARLERKYGAPMARSLYCSCDPVEYFPEPRASSRWDLGFIGTYSSDRQGVLDELLLEPARRRPTRQFVVAGPQYPDGIDWPANVERIQHLSPDRHRAFYASQRYTLNATRAEMVKAGWSPSVRLFEAAACATAIVSDAWEGLESFFEIGREVLVVRSAEEVLEILEDLPDAERREVGRRARARVLAAHTAAHRAAELEGYAREVMGSGARLAPGAQRTACGAAVKLVVFGLSISSSWGNGHATLWRGLCRALAARGHRVVFFERDVPYYAAHRDITELPGGGLCLYTDWHDVLPRVSSELADADVGMVTSYCPDGVAATEAVLSSRVWRRTFYDLDTPVTLDRLRAGESVPYLGPRGLRDFDLVLSYTGGRALDELRERLGARHVAPLYGSVDPAVHGPAQPVERYRADLSYLGTYAEDRQAALDRLLVEAARRVPHKRFLIGGALYPQLFPWAENIFLVRHLPPAEHAAFYSSSRVTLNVTRRAMAEMGYCPSGRLFEAAACGVPILSDDWDGLDRFYRPGEEILIARGTEDTLQVIDLPDAVLASVAQAARQRTLEEHTADRRARELEAALESAPSDAAGAPARAGA